MCLCSRTGTGGSSRASRVGTQQLGFHMCGFARGAKSGSGLKLCSAVAEQGDRARGSGIVCSQSRC
ncbi:hypothetical protein DPMN_157624 [Dreissena polymorpha]|uniref:Uncharacterized protein n=1 Tax=Dreissena polymorpha TaxID=45954 RepID=A0A9D4EGC2_DREPO|nr:hypothetical protein DPMN_157624 [Dreissena polymorpha]